MAKLIDQRVPSAIVSIALQISRNREVVDVATLRNMIVHIVDKDEDLDRLLPQGSGRFAASVLYRSRSFEIRTCRWPSEHETSPHQHNGSACAVKVLCGALTHTEYRQANDGSTQPVRTIEVPQDGIVSLTGRAIHRMANRHKDELFTLHMYAPPLQAPP